MQINLYQEKVRVFAAPVDFRKSIPGLLAIIMSDHTLNAKEGAYIFYNKSRDKIKCLFWHKNGFILLLKHLATGKFPFQHPLDTNSLLIGVDELSWLLGGIGVAKLMRCLCHFVKALF